jgi:hypothetical protein
MPSGWARAAEGRVPLLVLLLVLLLAPFPVVGRRAMSASSQVKSLLALRCRAVRQRGSL